MTRVVHCRKEPFDVYIGRPSIFGNPFTVEDHGRGEALKLYTEWVYTQPHIIEAAKSLQGKTLGCWCKPRACHGDVLAKIADGFTVLEVQGDFFK